MTDLVEKIKEDIVKSGLPTEIQVTNLLRQDNWIVINQYPYVEQGEQKVRTLDILAGKICKDGKLCILYVECKKSVDHQWVFYVSGGFEEGLSLLLRMIEGIIRLSKQKETERRGLPYSVHPNLSTNQGVGLISYIPFGKKDDFHTARSQLLSAIENRRLVADERLVIYPVIVFDGDVYTVQTKADDVTLSKTDNIVFLSTMISEATPVLIDIVTLNSFSSYLKLLNEELGPCYSYVEIQESIAEGLRKLQDFFEAIKSTARALENARRELGTVKQ